MNEELNSQISAFVDGELPVAEADLLTRRLAQDSELRQQAAAYLEIGRLLRGERSVAGASDLHRRVASALDGEVLPDVSVQPTETRQWMKPLARVAIAASVAIIALVGLRQLDVPGSDSATFIANDAGPYTEPLAIDVMADRPSDMLMQYYLSHGETSGELGANGILSRLVTLELRGGELVEVPSGVDNDRETSLPVDETTPTDNVQEQ